MNKSGFILFKAPWSMFLICILQLLLSSATRIIPCCIENNVDNMAELKRIPFKVALGRDPIGECECNVSPVVFVFCFGKFHCQAMPMNINTSLKITSSNIHELKPSDFEKLRLEGLQIDGSWNVAKIFLQNSNLSLFTIIQGLDNFRTLCFINLTHKLDNPFDCEVYREWLSKASDTKVKIFIKCFFETSTDFIASDFDEVYKSLNCSSESNSNPIFIVSMTAALLTVLVFAFCCYLLRWHIRYRIFLARSYLVRTGIIRPTSHKNDNTKTYHYDAFVSYNKEDKEFTTKLFTMLETQRPFLKLYDCERDLDAEANIFECLSKIMAKSRRILIIISDHYAKCPRCRWESEIAEVYRLMSDDGNSENVDDRLILIKLGCVSEIGLTPTLKYMLKSRVCLVWKDDGKKQNTFWNRLRKLLASR